MVLSLFAMTSCENETEFPPLQLDREEVILTRGETAIVNITRGSSDFSITTNKPEVAKVQLLKTKKGADIFYQVEIVALKQGQATVLVQDNNSRRRKEIKVKVNTRNIELSLTQLVDMFKMPAQALQASLEGAKIDSKQLQASQQATYTVKLEGIDMFMTHECTGETHIGLTLCPIDSTKNRQLFEEMLGKVEKLDKSVFFNSLIGTYNEEGKLLTNNIKVLRTTDKLRAELPNANWKTDIVRASFNIDKVTNFELRCNRGKESFIVRPKINGDNWHWYLSFLGKNFEETYMDLLYQVKSMGMSPATGEQLFILEGKEHYHGNHFNAVFFAGRNTPISRIEISFRDLEGDTDKLQQVWLSMMEDKAVEDNFGKFKETFIQPLQGDGLVRLATLSETIKWVKEKGLTMMSWIEPKFQTKKNIAITPRINSTSFVIEMNGNEGKSNQ